MTVTNIGIRSVVINSLGWSIGKRKKRKYCIQIVSSSPYTQQYPIELAQGKEAIFAIFFDKAPNWMARFARGFVKDLSEKSINTLRFRVSASVGHTVEIVPEKNFLEQLRSLEVTDRDDKS